ncbi:MAG TPA: hypothetical protein VNA21_01875, partial [Steroidobacteraceae bacterium]|nr:hypothetical protein [Steroidobacteraceae bacterium]
TFVGRVAFGMEDFVREVEQVNREDSFDLTLPKGPLVGDLLANGPLAEGRRVILRVKLNSR